MELYLNRTVTLTRILACLLITMANQSKISKHELSESNDAEEQAKQTKLCHSASKVEEKKNEKVSKTKVVHDSRLDYTPRATSELVYSNYGYMENLTGKLEEIIASLIII